MSIAPCHGDIRHGEKNLAGVEGPFYNDKNNSSLIPLKHFSLGLPFRVFSMHLLLFKLDLAVAHSLEF